MTWAMHNTWPVGEGEEINSTHIEDLRKLYWALKYGISGVPSGTLVEYDASTTYVAYDTCLFEGYLYEYCPANLSSTITGYTPAESTDWVRIARYWVYSDFYPSNECKFANYIASAAQWSITDAWMWLPVTVNQYVQQTSQVSETEYSTTRPREEALGYNQKKKIGFRRYFNDPRYHNISEILKQIISGPIGTLHPHDRTPPNPTEPYIFFSGEPAGLYHDQKMNGLQSFVERLCESRMWYTGTNGNYLHEIIYYMGAPLPPLEPPNIADMAHQYWRTNCSRFETALKNIGSYDWYLDLSFPWKGQSADWPDGRLGCWRRMWKYSHYIPPAAYLLWPSELGTPPYADEDTGAFEYSQDAINWWKVEDNVNTAIAAAQAALAAADPDDMAEFVRRHYYVQRVWHKSEDIACPEGYTEVTPSDTGWEFLTENWWYEDAYQLHTEILNDCWRVMSYLCHVKFTATILFDHWRREINYLGDRFNSTFDGAKAEVEYGAWAESSTGLTSIPCGINNSTMEFRGELQEYYYGSPGDYINGGKIYLSGTLDDDLACMLLSISSVAVIFGVIVSSAVPTPTSENLPYVSVDHPDVEIIAELGITASRSVLDESTITYIAVSHDHAVDTKYDIRPTLSWPEIFTVPPVSSSSPDFVSTSVLEAQLNIQSNGEFLVSVNPYLLTLNNYTMDSFPCET